MKVTKTEFYIYLKLFGAILVAIFANWSLWYSPWRVGTFYSVILTYITLIGVVIYKIIKFFKKQKIKREEEQRQDKK